MTLNESLRNNEIEGESFKMHWAISELGFRPELEHVSKVIEEAVKQGVDHITALAIVTGESSWNSRAANFNSGSNDYGLFQLNNLWHNQHRGNVNNHIKAGVAHFKWCLNTENGNERKALSRYNTGNGDNATGRRYANYIIGHKNKIESKARTFTRGGGSGTTRFTR